LTNESFEREELNSSLCVTEKGLNVNSYSIQNLSWDESFSGYGPVVGCCEHGNEHWSSIKCGEFLD
jgi:hypothetical protein